METQTKTKSVFKYRPYKNGFPYRLLAYLHEHGKSAGVDVQREIGLNTWALSKGEIFYERASSNFDNIVNQLNQKGLVMLMENDHYDLTILGKEFMKYYAHKR